MKFQSLAGEAQRQRRRQRAISLLARCLPAVFFCRHLTPVFSSNSLSPGAIALSVARQQRNQNENYNPPRSSFFLWNIGVRAHEKRISLAECVCISAIITRTNDDLISPLLAAAGIICITHTPRRRRCCVTMDRARCLHYFIYTRIGPADNASNARSAQTIICLMHARTHIHIPTTLLFTQPVLFPVKNCQRGVCAKEISASSWASAARRSEILLWE